MKDKKVAIIGAGVMGSGLAQVTAQHGFETLLYDISSTALEEANNQIRNGVRVYNLKASKENTNKVHYADIKSRVHSVAEIKELTQVKIVIENVTENWTIKHDVYTKLKPIVTEDCIVLVNTSVIPITKIAALCPFPDRVIGVHFMNPVPLKDTVEVIRGCHTSDKTLDETLTFLNEICKEGIVVQDSPGFVSNRVLMPMINEAIFLLHERVATVEDIDKIFKKCFGHLMGPLETADLIGNDTILYSLDGLYENFGDPKFRPCILLRKMVDAGQLGKKSGHGFYKYQ